MITDNTKPTGRIWAYIGLILGGLGSVAANIAHSFIKPDTVNINGRSVPTPEDWSPEPGAVISAMAWPFLLFVAIEILARTPWPTRMSWNLLRWVGLPPVALVAAVVSYRHLSGLLDHYGEENLVVWLGPIAVDGLMFMATLALLATGKRHTRPTAPVSAPVPATDAPAPSIDTAPATVRPAAEPTTPATTTTHPEPANPATPSITPPPPAPVPTPTTEASSRPVVARPATVPAVNTAAATGPATPVVELLPRARRHAEAYEHEHGEPITSGQLAVRLQVPTKTAKDVLDVLHTHPTTNPAPRNGTPIGASR